MNTYKDPQYRGYYLGKIAVALVLLVVIAVAVTRYPALTTTPAAPSETPVVQSAELSSSPVAEASGTSAIAGAAPSPAQTGATEAVPAAGTAPAPAVESPAPVAVATATPTNLVTSAAPAAGIETAPTMESPGPAAAPAYPTASAAPTGIVSATAEAESAAASTGLAISRALVGETGQVTVLGTGKPNARIEIVLGGEVVDRAAVKGDGTWSYTYRPTPGVQEVAVQYLGEPDSRSLSRTFESAATAFGAAVATGAPTPTSPSAAPSQEPAPTSTVSAQAGAGQAYIVQEGDYLRKLALQFYGDETQWPVIYDGTNAMAARDPSFAVISDPNLIMPGWKLWIPAG